MHTIRLIAERERKIKNEMSDKGFATIKRIKTRALIGPPGAGKNVMGTILRMLSKGYENRVKIVVIVTSDVLREARGKDDNLGRDLNNNYDELRAHEEVVLSNLDDDLTCEAEDRKLISIIKAEDPDIIVLDGFPRTGPQGGRFSNCPNLEMMYLHAEQAQSEEGAAKRRQEAIALNERPRLEDEPKWVALRYKRQMDDLRACLKAYKRATGKKPVEIPRSLSIRERAVTLVKSFGLNLTLQTQILSVFDNPNSEVAQLVAKLEGRKTLILAPHDAGRPSAYQPIRRVFSSAVVCHC